MKLKNVTKCDIIIYEHKKTKILYVFCKVDRGTIKTTIITM